MEQAERTSRVAQEHQAVGNLLSRYVGQLLYGCGDKTCEQTTCATGRCNTTSRPIRDYTPRSARAIASALVSGPNPTARLCHRYRPERNGVNPPKDEGPLDPSSFMQLLCSTDRIKRLCVANPEIDSEIRIHWSQQELLHLHRKLENVAATDLEDWNKQTAKELAYPIHWLANWLIDGLGDRAPVLLNYVNNQVATGLAYPQTNATDPIDGSYNNWLAVLDHLDDRPSLRLLCRAISLAGVKINQEYKVRADTASRFVDYMRHPQGQFSRAFLGSLVSYVVQDDSNPEESPRAGESTNYRTGSLLAILLWLKKAFLHHWNESAMQRTDAVAVLSLGLLECLGWPFITNAFEDVLTTTELRGAQHKFVIPTVTARIDVVEAAQTHQQMPGSREEDSVHIFEFSTPFMVDDKAVFFRALNHLQMRQTYTTSRLARSLRTGSPVNSPAAGNFDGGELEECYLLLNVSRENVLQDALDQLWQRDTAELRRPLRVRLGEMNGTEVGHDLGGVQTEFFNLICQELFDDDLQVFKTDPGTGISFFCQGSLQPLYKFELCGVLFGLALYNGVALPINLPSAFYWNLLGYRVPDLYRIRDAWPDYARSLQAICAGDVDGLEAFFFMEANGLRLSVIAHNVPEMEDDRYILEVLDATRIDHHPARDGKDAAVENGEVHPKAQELNIVDIKSIADAWPGWQLRRSKHQPVELDKVSIREYAQDVIRWLTVGSVLPQWTAFKQGFFSVMPEKTLRILTPASLQAIMEGSKHLDLNELRRATQYEGFSPREKYIQQFWRVVSSWPEEKQKKLVKFVTAAERIPAGGAKNLLFRIQKADYEGPEHLPTSSTCFGVLNLPQYPDVETLQRKLDMALELGLEGFGQG